jgi:hypothetical protein
MPRLDRLVTLYLSHPARRILVWESRCRVPILMYHSISENLFGRSNPYYQINTAPAVFLRQMRWLRQNGYRTLSLKNLQVGLDQKQDLSKTVILTFDGGYEDIYTDVLPVIKMFGFTATVFLATGRIQDLPVGIDGAQFLTWHQVRELHAEGVQFGSHTVTHPDLRSLGPEQIEYEVGYSKETLEQKLGVPVECFSYPFAFPEEDHDFLRFLDGILENQGYECGVSTVIGRASPIHNRFHLPRLAINSWDDAALLRAKLEGGYDWLHWLQWLNKYIHHNVPPMQRSSWSESEEVN